MDEALRDEPDRYRLGGPIPPTLRPVPGQLSFLTAGVRPPAVDDLEGLLLGVAQVVRLGGTARLSFTTGFAESDTAAIIAISASARVSPSAIGTGE